MDDLKTAFELMQRQYDALHFDILRLRVMQAKSLRNVYLPRIVKQEVRKEKLKNALTLIAQILEDYD